MDCAEENAKNSPLLRLPPKIRNMIYVYSVGGNEITYSCKILEVDTERPVERASLSNSDAPPDSHASLDAHTPSDTNGAPSDAEWNQVQMILRMQGLHRMQTSRKMEIHCLTGMRPRMSKLRQTQTIYLTRRVNT